MPKFEDAETNEMSGEQNEPEPADGEEGEQLTTRERRRIQAESRKAGSKGSSRWGISTVRTISYTPPEKVRSQVEWIRAGDLVVDDRYNRDISQRWVDEIAASFNPDQLEILNVSRRLYRVVQRPHGEPTEEQVFDGNLEAANRVEIVVISGQHRLLATLKAKGPDFMLQCNVYDRLTEPQEAELFALFDEKKRPHQPWQRFRAHLFGLNEEAVEIDKIAKDTGLEVYVGSQTASRDGVIYAVSTIQNIYRMSGADFLRRILEIHYMSWQENQEGLTAPMLQGTALLLRRFGVYSQWRDEWLSQALSDPARNPLTIRQRAQGAATGISATSIAQEVARLEHRYYNMGRKGYQRLPNWNSTAREITLQSDAAEARSKVTGRGRKRSPEDGEGGNGGGDYANR